MKVNGPVLDPGDELFLFVEENRILLPMTNLSSAHLVSTNKSILVLPDKRNEVHFNQQKFKFT
jgi:hypothetical protein